MLYLRFLSLHLRAQMQHKASFFLAMLGQVLSSLGSLLGMVFLYLHFGAIEGFTLPEVLLCFATMLMAFSLAECFFRGLDTFAGTLRRAEFDRILVRPRGALYQVLCANVEISRIGRLLEAGLVLAYALPASGIHWSAGKVCTLAGMVLGGAALFSALFLVYAAICFFVTEGLEFFNIFTDGGREFGRYPFSIYGKAVLQFFTFVVPLACMQYYPLCYLLGRAPSSFWAWTPLLGQLFWLPACALWRLGIRHYKSTGS